MIPLGADDFSAFFKSIHGYDPFPWQERLARQVIGSGQWPSLLDLPTAAGKTAAIDIAIFHLACEAGEGPQRKAPMRVLFVIDRRIVVDEAFRRARKIAAALRGAADGVLLVVKQQLAQLSGDPRAPLHVARLRGGMPQERDWARSPAQPLVAVSTVDQVGSRLLFRGYGVSPRMWPVHAGLVGADALWLLDEVHLSQPFAETLDAIVAGHPADAKGILADKPRIAPFGVVHLSATPGNRKSDAFGLGYADRVRDTLKLRLTASKIARLVPVTDDLADALVTRALTLAGLLKEPATAVRKKKREGGANGTSDAVPRRLAVVVNRVNLARQVFERLRSEHGGEADVILLTGRVRPLDRDKLLHQLAPLFASPNRTALARPIILVATQTIEAGADLDVDALVTEIAPIDSLRQRFGRLDRLGLRVKSQAVIVAPTSAGDIKALESIYGKAAWATADWLKTLGGEVDFGIDAFQKHKITDDLLAPRARAPVLLPAYTDLWATTSPPPAATPEPALFLHGPGISADVQIVWRADISPADGAWTNISLGLCPPSSLEALPLPIWAVRKWLQGVGDAAFADVPERDHQAADGPHGRPCLRRDGERWVRAFARDLQPGDTLIVPCSYGGCDEYGWNPEYKGEVSDLGTESHYRHRLKGALRITEAMLSNALANTEQSSVSETWQRVARVIPDEGDFDAESIRAQLLEIKDLPATWTTLLKAVGSRRLRVQRLDDDNPSAGFAIWDERRLAAGLLDRKEEDDELRGDEAITDAEDSSATGKKVGLNCHLNHVAAKARDFAEQAGLPKPMVALLGLAGRMHDLGKADPRFQADLRGESALVRGDPALAALLISSPEGLLAKSERRAHGPNTQSAAPKNFRHEALSIALALQHPEVAKLSEDERDLLLWLVGTHHGYGRPFFPPSIDNASKTEARVTLDGVELVAAAEQAPLRLDHGWFERADRLRRAYGPWELARLEAIVRLADHAASAEEQDDSERQAPVKPIADASA